MAKAAQRPSGAVSDAADARDWHTSGLRRIAIFGGLAGYARSAG